jgi:hypothetical protein
VAVCTEFAQETTRNPDRRVIFPVKIKFRDLTATIYRPAKGFPFYRLAFKVAGKRRMLKARKKIENYLPHTANDLGWGALAIGKLFGIENRQVTKEELEQLEKISIPEKLALLAPPGVSVAEIIAGSIRNNPRSLLDPNAMPPPSLPMMKSPSGPTICFPRVDTFPDAKWSIGSKLKPR